MPFKNTTTSYGSVAKFFHWLTAILVIGMIFVGISFGYLPRGDFKFFLLHAHKSMGFTLLFIVILRLLWKWINPRPALPANTKNWEHFVIKWTHGLLYFGMIAMPISGIIMSYAAGYGITLWWIYKVPLPWIPKNRELAMLASDAHTFFAWAISILIGLHTLAAFKHAIINKDGVFQKMMPGSNKSKNYFR